MRKSARLVLVAGLLGGLAMLAHQPAPPAKVAAAKPVAVRVPAFLVDRAPKPDVRIFIVDRDPPDHCFEPRSQANAHQLLACG